MPKRRTNGRSIRLARIVLSERAGDVREAAQLIRLLAHRPVDPMMGREKIDMLIARAAEQLSFERARVAAIWWQEARRIDAWEMDALRAAVRSRRRAAH